jgi:hypothetical protein
LFIFFGHPPSLTTFAEKATAVDKKATADEDKFGMKKWNGKTDLPTIFLMIFRKYAWGKGLRWDENCGYLFFGLICLGP